MERDAALRDVAVESLRSFMRRGYLRTSYVDPAARSAPEDHATTSA